MGYSCATKRYRFTEWVAFEGGRGVWNNGTVAMELYDLKMDVQENTNRKVACTEQMHLISSPLTDL